ncbi:MAG: putative glycoside hydrolase [bacterium]|nr:putative glycoside hydrolase [bacterium]
MNLYSRTTSKTMITLGGVAFSFFLAFGVSGQKAEAREIIDTFPRLANIYYKSDISLAEAKELARWDALILGMELQYTSPDALRLIRELNPDVIMLAYVLSEEIPNWHFTISDENFPQRQLLDDFSGQWWLRSSSGSHVNFWPETRMVNVTNSAERFNGVRWNEYLPQFMHDNVMSTGHWDGIYYDNMFNNISWVNSGDIDLNGDGRAESAQTLDEAWREGMNDLLDLSRSLEGNDAIIIGGGGGEYYSYINGRLFEEFPSNLDGGWSGATEKYFDVLKKVQIPAVVIVNSNTTTGSAGDYRALRYLLTSTLLNDGFASFDFGPVRHADLWWYDEYDAYLGRSAGPARNLSNTGAGQGVWRRDFEKGIALVNSTGATQVVSLEEGFETITGTQDPETNSGETTATITLAPHDGIIVLKRQVSLDNGHFSNGAFTRSFTPDGDIVRQGLFTYTDEFAGGVEIVKKDMTGDGTIETVVAWADKVQIYDSGGFLRSEFYPYGSNYNRGVNLAVGDLEGDGRLEIVTGTGFGGGPHVRIFDHNGVLKHPGFFAYYAYFRGGVNVAVGDLNGDGKDEIITGAGRSGGPHVRYFNRFGQPLGGFFAYDDKFRGGVSVAVADLNFDGKAEIITGAGPGGGPHVRILNRFGTMVRAGFFALDLSWRGGVEVRASDINSDGYTDILVSAPNIF